MEKALLAVVSWYLSNFRSVSAGVGEGMPRAAKTDPLPVEMRLGFHFGMESLDLRLWHDQIIGPVED